MLSSTKRRQVTISLPAVYHRRRVLACLPRRIGFTECHLGGGEKKSTQLLTVPAETNAQRQKITE
jgi:hypothetical protein